MIKNFVNLPKPLPSAGMEAYLNERNLALSLDSKRLENYEKYLKYNRDNHNLDFLPIKLDIENVSRCNFRCTMCQVSDWKKGKRADDMPLKSFKNLIDTQYGLVEIKIQGMGEPLLQGDDFFSMIKYARKSHIWVRTVTNGSLLHIKDNYIKLIDSDPNEIQFSIDGSDKLVFEKIRRGSNFESVINNAELINNYCKKLGLLKTKMWVVVQKDNIHQLKELVILSAKIGFHSLCFSMSLNGWGQEKWQIYNDNSTISNNYSIDYYFDLVNLGNELGVAVSFWDMGTKFSTNSREKLCNWPFERAYISSDMRVVPCCMIANPESVDLGDANNLSETWNAEDYKKFRIAHLSGDIPSPCLACYKK